MKNQPPRLVLQWLTALLMTLFVLSGCGGSGASDLSSTTGRTGSVTVGITWPDTREIPASTKEVRISVHAQDSRSLDRTGTIVRPGSSITINDIPTGPVKLRGLAYDAAGKLVASGEGSMTVSPAGPNNGSVVLTPVPGEVDDDRYVIGGTVGVDPDDPSFLRIALNALINRTTGEPVLGLTAANFTVLEDGIRKTPITVEPASSGTGAADIVFIVDSTGSMSEEIAGVRNSIISFANSLKTEIGDLRLGGVDFGDENRTQFSLSSDFAGFQGWVSGLSAFGGDDTPENPLDAIGAAQGLSWRAGVQRVIIVLTDAPAHEGNSITSRTIESVAASLGSSFVVHTISPGGTRQAMVMNNKGELEPARSDRDISVLAGLTGGVDLTMPFNGNVDLNVLPIADLVSAGYIVRFKSIKATPPIDRQIRLVVQEGGISVADQIFPGRY